MALRRWKPFFPAFGAIDAAIEAATGGCSRDKYRQGRSDLVEMLCDAAGSGDDVRAEALCRLLDTAMANALLTLWAVPVTATMLTNTDVATGVAKAVGGLLRHEAGKVRALAGGVLAEWEASLEGAALDTLLQILRELEVAAPATGGCVVRSGGPETTTVLQADSMKNAGKISEDLECKRPKKMSSPGVPIAGGDRVRNEQTGEAKRKHPGPGAGGYYREEADDVKRQRKVPEMVEHRPRKMEPAMKSRCRASSWRSTDERCSSTSTRHRRV